MPRFEAERSNDMKRTMNFRLTGAAKNDRALSGRRSKPTTKPRSLRACVREGKRFDEKQLESSSLSDRSLVPRLSMTDLGVNGVFS